MGDHHTPPPRTIEWAIQQAIYRSQKNYPDIPGILRRLAQDVALIARSECRMKNKCRVNT